MPVGAFTLYTRNFDQMNPDEIVAATPMLALLTSAYTPNTDEATGHQVWADISANEIAAQGGYSAGGQALPTPTVVDIAQGKQFDSGDTTWNASGANIPAWRYGAIYLTGTVWGIVNPLIGYFIGDDTPADIPETLNGNPLTVNAPVGGWFDVT